MLLYTDFGKILKQFCHEKCLLIFKSFILTCRACLLVVNDIVYMYNYISELIRYIEAPSAMLTETSGEARCNHAHRHWPSGEARCNHTHIDLDHDLDLGHDHDPEFDLDPKFDLDPEFDIDPQFDLTHNSTLTQIDVADKGFIIKTLFLWAFLVIDASHARIGSLALDKVVDKSVALCPHCRMQLVV